MQKITPFFMFDNQTEEAARFYTSVFKDSRIVTLSRQGEDGPVYSAEFVLNGQPFMAFNGGPYFKFSEGLSLFVSCDSQEEVDYYWEKLSEGGQKDQCGWLKDKFGVSWQIVPSILGAMLRDKDKTRANRAMQAMLKMVKLDIAALQRAYEGDSATTT